MLGLDGALALLADVGVTNVELAGDYLGRSPRELRALVESHGIRIAGNHFGPRTMDGENLWYSEAGRSRILVEARELGLEHVGTGHYYNVPLTVDGFRRFACDLNIWGRAASAAGMKFYFHNHDGEFTRFDGRTSQYGVDQLHVPGQPGFLTGEPARASSDSSDAR